MAYRKVVAACDLWSGELISVGVDGRRVLLTNVEDVFYAYEDRCAHQGVPLSQGRLDGRILTCAAHCWKYDVSTGKGVNPANAVLRRFAVRVDSGGVLVDVEEPS